MASRMENFGDRLHRILLEKEMTQSDLARKVWNETRTDARGYEVVVGKDSISRYIHNRATPDPLTLKKIAEALKMAPEDLAPELVAGSKGTTSQPEVRIESLAGHSGKVLLQIRRAVPLDTAVKIASILSESDKDK